MKITDIKAKQILDSRGNPTLEVSVFVGDIVGTFQVPSGASTGKYEACELRDGESGKSSVNNAIGKIETLIKPALLGIDVCEQKKIDEIMITLDGTPQKTKLGGNSMIGVSVAVAKAAAKAKGLELYKYLAGLENIKPSRKEPFLYFNLINGGKHAKTLLAFQEFQLVPQVETSLESAKICMDFQKRLDEILVKEIGGPLVRGDEGGIALNVSDVFYPLKIMTEVAKDLGYDKKVKFAMDVAASSFYDGESKTYKLMGKNYAGDDMIDLYEKICQNFSMISIEDPFDEEEFLNFSILQKKLDDIILIGDDLTVTNKDRLGMAIDKKSIKGIIIKPNQIGTLSETLTTMKLARNNNIECIISHRSGETMDDFIGDLSCAFGCFGIKAGALGPRERDVKYERIIKINSQRN